MLDKVARKTGSWFKSTKLSSPAGLVLKHGCVMGPRTGEPVPEGRIKECFANAQKMVLANFDLVYCEGWASTQEVFFPTLHAWCLDKSGRVVDPTWTKRRYAREPSYFGVEISTDYMLKTMMRTSTHLPIIDNYGEGYPILKSMTELKKAIIRCRGR